MRLRRSLFRPLALAGGLACAAAACTLFNPLDGYTGGASAEAGPDTLPILPPVEAGVDAEAGPSCVAAHPPERLPGVAGGTITFVNSLLTFEASDLRDPKSPNTQGYDLDDTCTCPGARSCMPTSGAGVCDYPNGVDNAAGTYLLSLLTLLGDANSITARLHTGSDGLLLRVSGYNGQPDDADVEVGLFTSFGLEGAVDAGADAARPKFDGTDRWTVDVRSLLGGVPYLPTIVDTRAYVRGGVLVASISGALRIGVYPLPMLSGVLTARITKAGDSYALVDGIVSGRLGATKLLTGFENVPDPLVPGGFLCGTDRLYLNLRDSICSTLDVSSDRTQDGKDAPCDAASFAVRFTSVPSVLGAVIDPGPQKRPCGDAWVGTCP